MKYGYNGIFSVSKIADANDYHHIALTKLGTKVVFYLDGVADAAQYYDSGGFTFGDVFGIGATPYDDNHTFQGRID